MKTALCLALLCVGQLTVSAVESSETAYTALRVVGKQNGADSLNHVVEVRGRAGTPAPTSWKIALHDPSARGGLREFEVQGGKIVSERTPTARASGAPINFNQLNLDSEGAFTVADQEAKKVNLAFQRVDYTLQAGSHGPVWHLELFAGDDKVGFIDVAADNGAVVRRDLGRHAPPDERITRDNRPPPPPVEERYAGEQRPPREFREPPPDATEPRDPRDRRAYERDRDYDREDEEYSRRRERDHRAFPDRVQHHFERRASQIRRFFGGD
jgi:hypothetical protein